MTDEENLCKIKLNSDEKSKSEEPKEFVNMLMQAYRESTQSIINNCRDPLLKKRLEDALNRSWKI